MCTLLTDRSKKSSDNVKEIRVTICGILEKHDYSCNNFSGYASFCSIFSLCMESNALEKLRYKQVFFFL